MPYVPNAGDATQPTEDKSVESAALEFRTLKLDVIRSLKFPSGESVSYQGPLPSAINRAGRFLAFDSVTAQPIVGPLISEWTITQAQIANISTVAGSIASVSTVSTNIAAVNTVATNIAGVNSVYTNMAAVLAAPAQATAAANSATAAATSATNAASSATSAATSATSASASAATATTQATSATNSATAAANSATSASTSASTATVKAGEASTSATSATASAASATSSATSAANSATSANTSKLDAASSATSAASSATTATGAATAAANSASAAGGSATSAANSATSATASASTANTAATSAQANAVTAGTAAINATNQANAASTFATNSYNSSINAANSAASASASETMAISSAASAATSATAAQGYLAPVNSYSGSLLTITTGALSLSTDTGKPWVPGMPIKIVYNSAPTTNFMTGTITSYNSVSGAMDVNITAVTGSGTYSSWALSLSIAGGGDVTQTGTQTLTNKTISGGVYSGTIEQSGSVRSNIVAVPILTLDCSLSNYFTKTISGASTFAFANVPSARAYSFTFELTHTSGTVTWPTSVKWPGDVAPSLTTGKTHLFMFVTDDGGTRWRGAALANYTN